MYVLVYVFIRLYYLHAFISTCIRPFTKNQESTNWLNLHISFKSIWKQSKWTSNWQFFFFICFYTILFLCCTKLMLFMYCTLWLMCDKEMSHEFKYFYSKSTLNWTDKSEKRDVKNNVLQLLVSIHYGYVHEIVKLYIPFRLGFNEQQWIWSNSLKDGFNTPMLVD